MNTNDGGPVYPTMTDGGFAHGGMTIRQFYKGCLLASGECGTDDAARLADTAIEEDEEFAARQRAEAEQAATADAAE